VETLNESAKENNTVNVQWTQFGEEQKQVREPSTLVQSLLAAPVTGDNDCTNLEVQENASANLLASNHQLESRMQENCQSGSEGGAKPTFVPTPIGWSLRDALADISQQHLPVRRTTLLYFV